ncbi:hypothetical protein AB0M97_14000 [Streptomyces sp. NPDC051207]|uniref:hypothetical protein n=1 Tax=Streptomyces sp. NPDC051207 TaxID=3154641 RepID=UPI0034448432
MAGPATRFGRHVYAGSGPYLRFSASADEDSAITAPTEKIVVDDLWRKTKSTVPTANPFVNSLKWAAKGRR